VEFSTNELIWAIINFVAFFVLLRLFLYRPVLKLLDARREEVERNLAGAETARQESEAARADYERQVARAREEAQSLLSRAQATADKTKDELLAQAERQSHDIIERARKAISSEKERALVEIREEIADLAVMAASKVVERALDVEQHRRLVDDLVKKMPGPGGPSAGKTS
jgi:F-type H+-transporting ATPase subunit b